MSYRDRPTLKSSDHGDKDVVKALLTILEMDDGNRFSLHEGGHWGTLVCSEGCCALPVDGTPRNPSGHAAEFFAKRGSALATTATSKTRRERPVSEITYALPYSSDTVVK